MVSSAAVACVGVQGRLDFATNTNTTLTVGTSSGLTAALLYDHLGARDADDQPVLMPHVANLTRNVIVRSANPARAAT